MYGTVKFATGPNIPYIGHTGKITSLQEMFSLEAALDFGPDFKSKGLPLQIIELKVRYLEEWQAIEQFWAEGQEASSQQHQQADLLYQLNKARKQLGLPLEETLRQLNLFLPEDSARALRAFVRGARDKLAERNGEFVLT